MRKEIVITTLSTGILLSLSGVAFSRGTRRRAKKKTRHCPITGERVTVVHHIDPSYSGGGDNIDNSLPTSSVGHGVIHAKRAQRALKQGKPLEVISNELSAAYGPLGQMTISQRQNFYQILKNENIDLKEIKKDIKKRRSFSKH